MKQYLIFRKYSDSMGYRGGKFSILSFSRPNPNEAILSFGVILQGGAELEYSVDSENNVQYQCSRSTWIS